MPPTIRPLHTIAELEQVTDLEIAIWGIADREAAPSNLTHALVHSGGLVLGAYDGETMVGMALAFPAENEGKRLLWSHMAGVLPSHQGQGIGFALKQQQRAWALTQGYDEMRWTFDPIQRGNAHFNFHLLGASAALYHEDFYGSELNDALNIPAPTDRLEARWRLRDRRVVALASGGAPLKRLPPSAKATLLQRGADNSPLRHELPDLPTIYAEVPPNGAWLRALPLEGILAWRMAQRAALQMAFAAGYQAVDLLEHEGAAYYVLERQPRYALYVVQCSDGTLYTGIARDVQKRVAQHNAGKGAAYTKVRRPVRLLAAWQFADKSSALRAELAFKAQTRVEKLQLIDSGRAFMNATQFLPD
jgi:predicted GNAT superfamily acetyltransferase